MIRSRRMVWPSRFRRRQWKGGPVRSIDGHWFVKRRPGDMRKNGSEMREMWVRGGCVDLWRWEWWKSEKKSEMLRRIDVWNRSRGRAIMADRRRRKTWPGEKDDDDDRTKLMNKAKVTERTRNTTPKMRRSRSNSFYRRNRWAIMADRCRRSGERVRMMTMKRKESHLSLLFRRTVNCEEYRECYREKMYLFLWISMYLCWILMCNLS